MHPTQNKLLSSIILLILFLQISTEIYGVDLDAPPSITSGKTVVVPEVCVEDEQCLERLQHIDPLSPEFDKYYSIRCYMDAVQALNNDQLLGNNYISIEKT